MSDSNRQTVLPIDSLIGRRLADLDLSCVMLVERCGYRNIGKGLRRLKALRAGDVAQAGHLATALPKALEVPAEEVREAIERTTAQLSAAREKAWREAFAPHAIILTERERPSQITIAVLCGFDRQRRVDFPAGTPVLDYVRFVRSQIESRLSRYAGEVPLFGKATGFVINYSPDAAVVFDLEGNALQRLESAQKIGEFSFALSGRVVPLRFGSA